ADRHTGHRVFEGPVLLAHDEDLRVGVQVFEDLDQFADFHRRLLRVGGWCRSRGHTGVASGTAQGDSTRKSTSLRQQKIAENLRECGYPMWSGTCMRRRVGDVIAPHPVTVRAGPRWHRTARRGPPRLS